MYNKTRILIGPALEQLARLPNNHFHTIITSPPYWGLRSYKGDPGMIGLEPTWEDHVQNLLAVFRECRRVLRDDGTFWLNYGDAYANHTGSGNGKGLDDKIRGDSRELGRYNKPVIDGLPTKSLMMMPARLAIALQDDGWILRSEIIWHKPNPMPESVQDRPTCAHEKIFLFSKQPRYFYDHVAVMNKARHDDPRQEPGGMVRPSTHPESPYMSLKKTDKQSGHGPRHAGFNERYKQKQVSARRQAFLDVNRVNDKRDRNAGRTGTANLRNVWSISTCPYKGAHFATYPPKLIIPCIKAGTSEKGCCTTCGSPYQRVIDSKFIVTQRRKPTAVALGATETNDQSVNRLLDGSKSGGFRDIKTTGWATDCECDADTAPCRVLDPFGGSGTTAMVANRLQRDATIIEISPDYADMAAKRISDDGGFLVDVSVE